MNLEKEFVPYQESLELKELGFNEPCITYYYENTHKIRTGLSIHIDNGWTYSGTKRLETTLAPTFSQAFRWFRENYKLYPEIGLHDREDEQTWRFSISVLGYYELAYNQNVGREPYHKTYEEAELACLKKLIEIVKDGNKGR